MREKKREKEERKRERETPKGNSKLGWQPALCCLK